MAPACPMTIEGVAPSTSVATVEDRSPRAFCPELDGWIAGERKRARGLGRRRRAPHQRALCRHGPRYQQRQRPGDVRASAPIAGYGGAPAGRRKGAPLRGWGLRPKTSEAPEAPVTVAKQWQRPRGLAIENDALLLPLGHAWPAVNGPAGATGRVETGSGVYPARRLERSTACVELPRDRRAGHEASDPQAEQLHGLRDGPGSGPARLTTDRRPRRPRRRCRLATTRSDQSDRPEAPRAHASESATTEGRPPRAEPHRRGDSVTSPRRPRT